MTAGTLLMSVAAGAMVVLAYRLGERAARRRAEPYAAFALPVFKALRGGASSVLLHVTREGDDWRAVILPSGGDEQ